MPSAKYIASVQQMMDIHQDLFAKFQPIHDGYAQDRKQWSQQFHLLGGEVVQIMREWEHRLCSGMERGNNAVYSAKLAEKFWTEIKKRFPLIERVGVKSNLD